jgi:hypothetical protein
MTYSDMEYRFKDRPIKTMQEVKVVVEVRAPEPNSPVRNPVADATQSATTKLSQVDLAVAYPVDERIGFTLTVAGKPQQFTMKRSAAASFIGRMAEVLAK